MRRFLNTVFLFLLLSLSFPLPKEDFRKETVHSLRIVDRNGILLREFLNDTEGRGQWKALGELSPSLAQATIAIEDRRFRSHPGVDPVAVLRALVQNLQAGRFVSGGSTITQQVIRNVYHHPRTISTKLLEAWYALRLEMMQSKEEILEQYLNRVPYGNGLVGAEAAARHYFGKPARDLSPAEAAFLAALPNAPSALNPYTNMMDALARQRRVLTAMHNQGMITSDDYALALQQPVTLIPPEANFRAPHLVEMAAAKASECAGATLVKTTIDYEKQRDIEWLVRGHLRSLRDKHVTNAAVVVLDNKTMEVVALVGSADYFNPRIQGQVNGVLARRQPGSAVKPLTYALAFEGPFTAGDVVPDVPTRIPDQDGDYIPENYDRRYHGPVRLRTALACSYNVPAVRVLRVIGAENLLQRLRNAGLTTLDQESAFYGYGLTLGNGEVRLLDLTRAYSALANAGTLRPVTFISSIETVSGTVNPDAVPAASRVFSPQAAWLVTDILRDADARHPAFGQAFRFPFECAVKTGTTKDYRDNWTMGYTTEYTVGVWTGNFDGEPMKGVSGVTGAGPIFEDVMMYLHVRPAEPLPVGFEPPEGMLRRRICALSGLLPTPSCRRTLQEWFIEGKTPSARCTFHRPFRFVDNNGRVIEKIFEVFPDEYSEWAREQRLETPPPEAHPLPFRDRPEQTTRLVLVQPQPGQLFKLDPVLRREYQAIRILAQVPPGVRGVRLRVGDAEVMALQGRETWWPLRKGRHRFVLEGKRGQEVVRSDEVIIHVD
ncbi:MAG: penicillin-binding protein 1A [Bacteroidia bacterium]|nr:MAG: penicillin-binding protein 1A [Bacteroidia bacterium]